MSWTPLDFERDVGKIIYAKNYRLIPQYEPFGPGSYRIDFVIEGLKSRLAVEVDGPHHDDPEQIERDMARQRQLERCKWVFWRVSASSFYFDREKAMASLWRKLEELGIHPLAASQSEAKPEAPPQSERTSPPPTAPPPAPQNIPKPFPKTSSPTRQRDLIPSNQMELPTSKTEPQPSHADATHEAKIKELREYVLAAKQTRTYGVLVYEEIGHVVLELLPRQARIHRNELVRNTAEVLEFEEVAFKRIDEAIQRLEELKKVSTDSNYVWHRVS